MKISQSNCFMTNSGTLISTVNSVLSADGEPSTEVHFPLVPVDGDSVSSITVVHPVPPIWGDCGSSITVTHPILPLPGEGYHPIRPLADTTAEATSINESIEMSGFDTAISLANEMSASIDTLYEVIGVTDNTDNLLSL